MHQPCFYPIQHREMDPQGEDNEGSEGRTSSNYRRDTRASSC